MIDSSLPVQYWLTGQKKKRGVNFLTLNSIIFLQLTWFIKALLMKTWQDL